MSTRVIAYTRVSTEEQANSGLGLEAQRAALDAECIRRGWTDVTWVIEQGSGRGLDQRPGLRHALLELAAGEAGTLLVVRLDRLSRSVQGMARIIETAEREGWHLVALDLGLDMTTAIGRMVAHMVAAVSQYYVDVLSENTRAALAAKKARGARLGRPSRVEPATVERIAELRAEGLTWRAVAEVMSEEGWRTGYGAPSWAPATCRAIWVRAS
jgi:DNA invertase Pin-like site-specific DNA recombinase